MLVKKVIRSNRNIVKLFNKQSVEYVNINTDRHFSTKSWVPTESSVLQKVTTQALIHEVSLQQMDASAKWVPWFLKNLPASYFRQVPESTRKQHLKAIIALKELQSELSLSIDTKHDDGSSEKTYIITDNIPGLLHRQIKSLVVPKDS
eukprot:gene43826-59363_t